MLCPDETLATMKDNLWRQRDNKLACPQVDINLATVTSKAFFSEEGNESRNRTETKNNMQQPNLVRLETNKKKNKIEKKNTK